MSWTILRLTLLSLLSGITLAAELDTAFTYQGVLNNGSQPGTGSYDLRFTLYDQASGGSVVAGPTTQTVVVSDGLFNAELDFGADVFTGTARWLEIGVRLAGSQAEFALLSPRQRLTAAPHAIHAVKAASAITAETASGVQPGAVGNEALQPGSVTTAKLADGAVTAGKLAADSVGTLALADGTVNTAKLASGSVGSDHILDAAILGRHLAPGAVPPPINVTESSYIIYPDGTDFVSRDGAIGNIFTSGSDAATVFQATIDQVATEGGGRIFVKAGTYPLTKRLEIGRAASGLAQNNITIEGTDATVLTSAAGATIGTALLIDQGSDAITLTRLTLRDCESKGINIALGSNVRILNCVFESIAEPAIQVGIGQNRGATNLWILGCRVTRADSASQASGAHGGIYIFKTQNLYIQDNLVEQCGSIGISVQANSSHVLCANNVVRDNDQNALVGLGHGLNIGPCDHVTVQGNVIQNNGGNGFEGASGDYNEAGDRGPLFVVIGNVLTGNGLHRSSGPTGAYRAGLYITGRHHVVSDNVCRENWGPGISVGYANRSQKIIVQGNVVGDNNVGNETDPNHTSGIVCQSSTDGSTTDQLILIKDNLVYEDPAVGGPQFRAIQCATHVDGITIEGNRVSGHPQPQISFDPTMTRIIVRRNVGFLTATDGTVSASPGGATTGTEPVDLASSLDLDDVGVSLRRRQFQVQLAGSAGSYSGGSFHYWVEQTTATAFAIHWESGMAPALVEFDWRYED